MALYTISFTISTGKTRGIGKKHVEKWVLDGLATAEKLPKDIKLSVEKLELDKSRAKRLAEAQALVESANGIIQELTEEMESWRDGMPENLQGGDKYTEVDTAASVLQDLNSQLDYLYWDVDFPNAFG